MENPNKKELLSKITIEEIIRAIESLDEPDKKLIKIYFGLDNEEELKIEQIDEPDKKRRK